MILQHISYLVQWIMPLEGKITGQEHAITHSLEIVPPIWSLIAGTHNPKMLSLPDLIMFSVIRSGLQIWRNCWREWHKKFSVVIVCLLSLELFILGVQANKLQFCNLELILNKTGYSHIMESKNIFFSFFNMGTSWKKFDPPCFFPIFSRTRQNFW